MWWPGTVWNSQYAQSLPSTTEYSFAAASSNLGMGVLPVTVPNNMSAVSGFSHDSALAARSVAAHPPNLYVKAPSSMMSSIGEAQDMMQLRDNTGMYAGYLNGVNNFTNCLININQGKPIPHVAKQGFQILQASQGDNALVPVPIQSLATQLRSMPVQFGANSQSVFEQMLNVSIGQMIQCEKNISIMRDHLAAMGCNTTIPPFQQQIAAPYLVPLSQAMANIQEVSMAAGGMPQLSPINVCRAQAPIMTDSEDFGGFFLQPQPSMHWDMQSLKEMCPLYGQMPLQEMPSWPLFSQGFGGFVPPEMAHMISPFRGTSIAASQPYMQAWQASRAGGLDRIRGLASHALSKRLDQFPRPAVIAPPSYAEALKVSKFAHLSEGGVYQNDDKHINANNLGKGIDSTTGVTQTLVSSHRLKELRACCESGDVEALKGLKEEGMDLNNSYDVLNGHTPLTFICQKVGDIAFAEELMRLVDVNKENMNGFTPLQVALGGSNTQCIDLLYKYKARVDSTNIKKNLESAASSGKTENVDKVFKHLNSSLSANKIYQEVEQLTLPQDSTDASVGSNELLERLYLRQSNMPEELRLTSENIDNIKKISPVPAFVEAKTAKGLNGAYTSYQWCNLSATARSIFLSKANEFVDKTDESTSKSTDSGEILNKLDEVPEVHPNAQEQLVIDKTFDEQKLRDAQKNLDREDPLGEQKLHDAQENLDREDPLGEQKLYEAQDDLDKKDQGGVHEPLSVEEMSNVQEPISSTFINDLYENLMKCYQGDERDALGDLIRDENLDLNKGHEILNGHTILTFMCMMDRNPSTVFVDELMKLVDVNKSCSGNFSPIEAAFHKKNTKYIDLLFKHKVQVDDKNIEMLLQEAVANRDVSNASKIFKYIDPLVSANTIYEIIQNLKCSDEPIINELLEMLYVWNSSAPEERRLTNENIDSIWLRSPIAKISTVKTLIEADDIENDYQEQGLSATATKQLYRQRAGIMAEMVEIPERLEEGLYELYRLHALIGTSIELSDLDPKARTILEGSRNGALNRYVLEAVLYEKEYAAKSAISNKDGLELRQDESMGMGANHFVDIVTKDLDFSVEHAKQEHSKFIKSFNDEVVTIKEFDFAARFFDGCNVVISRNGIIKHGELLEVLEGHMIRLLEQEKDPDYMLLKDDHVLLANIIKSWEEENGALLHPYLIEFKQLLRKPSMQIRQLVSLLPTFAEDGLNEYKGKRSERYKKQSFYKEADELSVGLNQEHGLEALFVEEARSRGLGELIGTGELAAKIFVEKPLLSEIDDTTNKLTGAGKTYDELDEDTKVKTPPTKDFMGKLHERLILSYPENNNGGMFDSIIKFEIIDLNKAYDVLKGHSPLTFLCEHDNNVSLDVANDLMDHVDINGKNENGFSPIEVALMNSKTEYIDLLLKKGVKVDSNNIKQLLQAVVNSDNKGNATAILKYLDTSISADNVYEIIESLEYPNVVEGKANEGKKELFEVLYIWQYSIPKDRMLKANNTKNIDEISHVVGILSATKVEYFSAVIGDPNLSRIAYNLAYQQIIDFIAQDLEKPETMSKGLSNLFMQVGPAGQILKSLDLSDRARTLLNALDTGELSRFVKDVVEYGEGDDNSFRKEALFSKFVINYIDQVLRNNKHNEEKNINDVMDVDVMVDDWDFSPPSQGSAIEITRRQIMMNYQYFVNVEEKMAACLLNNANVDRVMVDDEKQIFQSMLDDWNTWERDNSGKLHPCLQKIKGLLEKNDDNVKISDLKNLLFFENNNGETTSKVSISEVYKKQGFYKNVTDNMDKLKQIYGNEYLDKNLDGVLLSLALVKRQYSS